VASDEEGTPVLQVSRHSAEGVLDESFDISEPLLEPRTAILDRDERLLVAGERTGKEVPSFIARYLPSGTLDESFGKGGIVEANLSTSLEEVTGLVQLDDGKILAIGNARTESGATVVTVARYGEGGDLDLTFGDSGTLITDIELRTTRGAVVDAEGRVIVAGRASGAPAATRLLSDGTIDRSFGESGLATVDFGVASDVASGANGAALDADGRIVISGGVGDSDTRQVALARLWP
jgi:uncharacterized delta-60 repeat protein